MRYLLRRFGFYLVTVWIALTINFILPRLMPGDPADVLFARLGGQIGEEQVQAMRIAYGFSDSPLLVQYFEYLSHAVRGDFGLSFLYFPARVTDVIAIGLRWTLLLGFSTIALSFLIGTTLGMLGVWRRGGWLDSLLPPLASFINSFPGFYVGMLMLFVFGFQLDWFPVRHAYSDTLTPAWTPQFLLDVAYHLVLPVGTMALLSFGGWMLNMRNTMIGILAEDYVVLAEAKGLSQNAVMVRYAARNALLPTVTSLGMAIGYVIGGQVFTETIFSYPGLGYLLMQAISALDYPLMQALFLMITLSVLTANLVVDLLYFRLDPRIRAA